MPFLQLDWFVLAAVASLFLPFLLAKNIFDYKILRPLKFSVFWNNTQTWNRFSLSDLDWCNFRIFHVQFVYFWLEIVHLLLQQVVHPLQIRVSLFQDGIVRHERKFTRFEVFKILLAGLARIRSVVALVLLHSVECGNQIAKTILFRVPR